MTSSQCVIDCSDDESYFESVLPYRTHSNGSRIWEPEGEDIIRLYGEIEAHGFNKLEWQCPGRLSPSQLSQQDDRKGTDAEKANNEKNSNSTKSPSKFDFDNEFDDAEFSNPNTKVTKRSQVVKKSQTDLSKIMFDIKKYQKIDQKTTTTSTKYKSTTTSLHSASETSNSASKTISNSSELILQDFDDEMDFD